MTIKDIRGFPVYQSPLLDNAAGVQHAVFTRLGGISSGPFDSLNVGHELGDTYENVSENVRRVATVFDAEPNMVRFPYQVHRNNVIVAQDKQPAVATEADGMITDVPGMPLLMRFADCVPILLYDPVNQAAGLAHAGWKGTVMRVAQKTVEAMTHNYGSEPSDIVAVVGPSIGPEDYEVGQELRDQFEQAFGVETSDTLFNSPNGPDANPYLNLWEANRMVLEEAGVTKVDIAEISTASNTELFFSYRAEAGETGRFGALIMLT